MCRRFTLAHLYAGGDGVIEGFVRRTLRRLRTPVRLFMMLVTWRPAILHINTALNARALPRDAALLLVAWLTRCPVVWQVHGGSSIVELERNQPMVLPMLRLLLRFPRRVVVISGQDELGYAKLVALRPPASHSERGAGPGSVRAALRSLRSVPACAWRTWGVSWRERVFSI